LPALCLCIALTAILLSAPATALQWRRDALCDPLRPPSPQGGLVCLPAEPGRDRPDSNGALNLPLAPGGSVVADPTQPPALPLGTMPDGARLLLTGPRPRPAIEQLERDLERAGERPRLLDDVGLGLRLTTPLYPEPARRGAD